MIVDKMDTAWRGADPVDGDLAAGLGAHHFQQALAQGPRRRLARNALTPGEESRQLAALEEALLPGLDLCLLERGEERLGDLVLGHRNLDPSSWVFAVICPPGTK